MGPMHESVCLTPLASAVSLEALMLGPEGPTGFDVLDTAPTAEEVIDARRAAEAVRAFLRDLPQGQQTLLIRIFWNGDTQASAARSLGVSEAAVSKSLAKILATGRKRLSRYRPSRLNGLQAGDAALSCLAA